MSIVRTEKGVDIEIRPMRDEDMNAVVELSLAAWKPVFDSFQHVLGAKIFTLIYPNWVKSQQETVETVFKDREKFTTVVAEQDRQVAGFLTYELNAEEQTGEVYLLAVHPDYQNHGVGTALNSFALDRFKELGLKLAVVGTGGDEGHAPARRSYEKAGYRALPLVRYYKDL